MRKQPQSNTRKYLSPLDIPAGKSGDAEVVRETKPAGETFKLNSLRTAFFGQKGGSVTFNHPTVWHQLLIDGGRMMSDWPIEHKQHMECLKGMRGRVLVGGLGLGLAATILTKRKSITQVVVVEVSQDVIDLVAPHIAGGKQEVVKADLLQWLKDYQGPKFDYAFYDIWASDGEGTFFETVVPLYQLSHNKVKTLPVCWNEDVMRGQLQSSLRSRLMWATMSPEDLDHIKAGEAMRQEIDNLDREDGTDEPWHNWVVPFFRWWKAAGKPQGDRLDNAIAYYASHYGLPGFATLWGFFVKAI